MDNHMSSVSPTTPPRRQKTLFRANSQTTFRSRSQTESREPMLVGYSSRIMIFARGRHSFTLFHSSIRSLLLSLYVVVVVVVSSVASFI